MEELIFEIWYKKDGLKYINNYIIDEINENWCDYSGNNGEIYNKIISLLHANSSIIDSIDNILNFYQKNIDKNI